jgi:predicted phosphodiesterase
MIRSPPHLRLGIVSDLHHISEPSGALAYHHAFDVTEVLPRLRAAIAWFDAEEVDAVVVAGDLTHHGTDDALDAVLQAITSAWPGRVLVVAGNHDVLVDEDAVAHAVARAGAERLTLSTQDGVKIAGVRVVGVEIGASGWAETISDWGGDVVVLVSHWPVLPRRSAFAEQALRYAGDPPFPLPTGDALSARPGPTIVINGHLHARDSHRHANVAQLSVAALVEPPYEATVLDLRVGEASVTVHRRARAFGAHAVKRLPVLVPTRETLALDSVRRI